MGEKVKGKANELCFNCKNALGGCSWSRDFVPVEGWTATPTIYGDPRYPTKSYCITACPKFAPDEPQTHGYIDNDGIVKLFVAYAKGLAKEYRKVYRTMRTASSEEKRKKAAADLKSLGEGLPKEIACSLRIEVENELKAMVEQRL